MRSYSVREILPNNFFSEEIILDNGYVLTAPEMRLLPAMLSALTAWNFEEVHSEGVPQAIYKAVSDDEQSKFTQNDKDDILHAEQYYINLQIWAGHLFERVQYKQNITFNEIAEKIKEIITELTKNRRFLLQVQKDVAKVNDENYLLSHTVKSAIIALVIGQTLKFQPHRLIELGAAAVLHEIGMTRIPLKIYSASTDLTSAEKEMIYMHPQLGFDILKTNGFPMAVCAPALEHHERENGSGYPLNLNADSISIYSKIIAVACSYEAITTYRPHKTAQNGYEGMLHLLRNENKQYNENVLNALVRSLSLFPIGQYVLLSNGKKAQVIDVNPADPRNPVLQIFEEKTPDGKNKIITSNPKEIYITQVIDDINLQPRRQFN